MQYIKARNKYNAKGKNLKKITNKVRKFGCEYDVDRSSRDSGEALSGTVEKDWES